MSRLTGTDAYGLMEAYSAVYAPQELTEEQVWEEVETWVNSLLEEGYDLSDYTWEEMYESYIEEIYQTMPLSPSKPPSKLSNIPPTVKNSPYNLKNLGAAQYAAYKGAGGDAAMAQGKGTVGQLVAQGRKNISRFDGGPRQGNPNIVGSPVVGSRTTTTTTPPTRTTTPPARPAATAPAATPPAKTKVTPTKPTATATPTPAPSASPARPSLSSQADEIRKMRAGSLARQGKTLEAATVSGTTKPAYQANSFDPFDIVKGHLIDEGYADTEEAALVIMANMSESWKNSIIG